MTVPSTNGTIADGALLRACDPKNYTSRALSQQSPTTYNVSPTITYIDLKQQKKRKVVHRVTTIYNYKHQFLLFHCLAQTPQSKYK